MGDSLIGVGHECDYPPPALRLPRVTRSRINPTASSMEIEQAVESSLRAGDPLYAIDADLLERLQPDLIITQGLCDVCAVSTNLVEDAIQGRPCKPHVLDLEPHCLSDILDNVRTVGATLNQQQAAETLVENLTTRIEFVRRRAATAGSRPRVVCMEWVDPPYCGGHWMKELVEIAGGHDDLATDARPSHRIDWELVLE